MNRSRLPTRALILRIRITQGAIRASEVIEFGETAARRSLFFVLKDQEMTLANGWYWHMASFRCAAEFGRYRAQRTLVEPAPIKLDL
jgi:hypothetical protein